jgi:hypothetical protein
MMVPPCPEGMGPLLQTVRFPALRDFALPPHWSDYSSEEVSTPDRNSVASTRIATSENGRDRNSGLLPNMQVPEHSARRRSNDRSPKSIITKRNLHQNLRRLNPIPEPQNRRRRVNTDGTSVAGAQSCKLPTAAVSRRAHKGTHELSIHLGCERIHVDAVQPPRFRDGVVSGDGW